MSEQPGLPSSHLVLAVAVMAVWGSNFVVVHVALEALPPLLLAALRYTVAFLPLALVLKRPQASWGNLAAYGLLIGVGQFGLLFTALRGDITPGLASLVMQVQVFITIGLAFVLEGERVHRFQIVALLLGAAGLATIAAFAGGGATPLGLALCLGAAASWAGGNMVARAAGRVDMLNYVVWASLFAAPPLFLLSALIEGPGAMAQGLARADTVTWAAVVWQSVANTMFGYGVWGWLLARHPAASVAPLALLIPVFGLGSSALLLGEPLQLWKLGAAALVMGGLALGILWPRFVTALKTGPS